MGEVIMPVVPYCIRKNGPPQNGCMSRLHQSQKHISGYFRKVEKSAGQIAETRTMHVTPGLYKTSV